MDLCSKNGGERSLFQQFQSMEQQIAGASDPGFILCRCMSTKSDQLLGNGIGKLLGDPQREKRERLLPLP